jgi:hypothetical protein
MVGRGEAAGELEPRSEGGERLAGGRAALGAEQHRHRRDRRREVREPWQVRVVVVEHVAGGAGGGDPLAEPVPERARRAGGPLLAPAGGARQPVEQRGAVAGRRRRHAVSPASPAA